jgi:hypothetical protein
VSALLSGSVAEPVSVTVAPEVTVWGEAVALLTTGALLVVLGLLDALPGFDPALISTSLLKVSPSESRGAMVAMAAWVRPALL